MVGLHQGTSWPSLQYSQVKYLLSSFRGHRTAHTQELHQPVGLLHGLDASCLPENTGMHNSVGSPSDSYPSLGSFGLYSREDKLMTECVGHWLFLSIRT